MRNIDARLRIELSVRNGEPMRCYTLVPGGSTALRALKLSLSFSRRLRSDKTCCCWSTEGGGAMVILHHCLCLWMWASQATCILSKADMAALIALWPQAPGFGFVLGLRCRTYGLNAPRDSPCSWVTMLSRFRIVSRLSKHRSSWCSPQVIGDSGICREETSTGWWKEVVVAVLPETEPNDEVGTVLVLYSSSSVSISV
jgi:hypothetical protein